MKVLMIALVLITTIASSYADELCLIRHCTRSSDASYLCVPGEQGYPFFNINGTGIPTYTDTTDHATTVNYYRACAEAEKVLELGKNTISFHTSWGDGSPLTKGWIRNTLYGTLAGNRIFTLCDFTIKPGGDGGFYECEQTYETELEDISPELYAEVQAALKAIRDIWAEQPAVETEFTEKLETATEAFDAIVDLDFDQITESQLSKVESALALYRDLRRALSDIRNDVSKLRTEFTETLTALNEVIDNELARENIQPEDYAINHPLDLPAIVIPDLVDDYLFTPEQNFYTHYADLTLNILSGHVANEQYSEFIIAVKVWLNTIERLDNHLASHTIESCEERIAFNASVKRVEDYVFGSGTQPAILGSDLWFTDSPLDQHQKDAIEYIAELFPAEGQALESEFRSVRNPFSQVEARVANALVGISAGAKQIIIAGDDPSVLKSLVSGALSFLKENGECLGIAIVAGDFGDYYELIHGVSICDGKPLSTAERVFSGLGLVAGSGAFWRGVGEALGLLPGAKLAANIASNIKILGERLGFSQSEIVTLRKDFNAQRVCSRVAVNLRNSEINSDDCVPDDFADSFERMLKEADEFNMPKDDILKSVRDKEFVEIPGLPGQNQYPAGRKGAWSEALNNPKPNWEVLIDGSLYKTDHLGRTIEVIVPKLRLYESDRHRHQQRMVGGKDRISEPENPTADDTWDHGGHLLGYRFGGAGEAINLVAMDKKLNSNHNIDGVWGQLEDQWAKAVDELKEVSLNIKPVYDGASLRPARFYVFYVIDGLEDFRIIKNQPGG